MADEENTAVKTAPEKQWVKITNKAPGPRMVLLSTEGKTIQKGGFVVVEVTEQDFKGFKPYVDLGHFELSEPSEDELPKTAENNDIGGDPIKTGNPVASALHGGEGDIVPASEGDDDDFEAGDGEHGPGTDDDAEEDLDADPDAPTHVEHRGFGRYYGMAGDAKITSAMSEVEANAYAQEHNLQAPVVPNPSNEDAPAEEPAPSADETATEETVADETATEETVVEDAVNPAADADADADPDA